MSSTQWIHYPSNYFENNLDYWSDKQFYLAFDFYCPKTLKFQIVFRSKMLITKKYLGQMHLVENFLSFQMDLFIFSVGALKGGKNADEVDPS